MFYHLLLKTTQLQASYRVWGVSRGVWGCWGETMASCICSISLYQHSTSSKELFFRILFRGAPLQDPWEGSYKDLLLKLTSISFGSLGGLVLVRSWGQFWSLWGRFGVFGCLLGPLGSLLGASWGPLGCLLGRSWGGPEPS